MGFGKTFTGNEEITFNVLPAGNYTVKVETSEEAISKNSGKDMIKLTLAVKGDNRKLFYYIVDDEYADNKIISIFKSAGKPLPKQVNANSFINLVFNVQTNVKEDRASVKKIILPKKEETTIVKEVVANVDDIPF